MSSFNEQLARMQNLISYGQITEAEDKPARSIEYHEIAADGKSYAIIRENAHYVIKKAPADKATVLESYEYLDGWNHLDKHEYHSYNEAKKQFGFKMSSLNEAYNYRVNKDDIAEYQNQALMTEGSEEMMKETARMRQIMNNTAAILQESTGICKRCSEDPERVAGNSNPDEPFTNKAEATLDKDPKAASGKPESMGDPYGNKKKAECGKDAKVDGSVACQKPAGGKAVKMNEADEKTFNAGLPGSAGIGEPSETKKHIMEDDDIEIQDTDADVPEDDELELSADNGDIAPEEPEGSDELDIDGSDKAIGDEDSGEEPEEETIEDLKQQIDDLEERISELEGDDEESDDEDADIDLDDDEDADLEDDEDADLDDDGEDAGDDVLDLTDGSEESKDFMESVVRNASKTILKEGIGSKMAAGAFLDGLENGSTGKAKDIVRGNGDSKFTTDYKKAMAGSYPKGSEEREDAEIDAYRGDSSFSGKAKRAGALAANRLGGAIHGVKKGLGRMKGKTDESKERFMNSIVEGVVRNIREDRTELHDFGKHPGYRKKPMELPETGSDQEGQYRDWNDESVHNEQPFGQRIGDGKPYDKEAMVQAVTEEVMKMIKKKA